jgi:hypothetical protein
MGLYGIAIHHTAFKERSYNKSHGEKEEVWADEDGLLLLLWWGEKCCVTQKKKVQQRAREQKTLEKRL